MNFEIVAEHFGGEVKVISAISQFTDHRGFFNVSYREDDFTTLGLPKFVQDNHSRSTRGVIRGLHFQLDPPMGKLMRVTLGRAYLVAVDIRRNSPTFLKYCGVYADKCGLQVWAPAGFARGFAVLSDVADVQYKCSAFHNAASERALVWDDPSVSIDWPFKNPILSEKDANAPTWRYVCAR